MTTITVSTPSYIVKQARGAWIVMDRADYEPSWWVRLWTWLLLGWKWKRYGHSASESTK